MNPDREFDRREFDKDVQRIARRILEEDIGSGDLTAGLIDAGARARATIVTREPMTLAGRPFVDALFGVLDAGIAVEWCADDGDALGADAVLCRLEGPSRSLLSGERGALNILQTLSATASTTARYVEAVSGTGCRILDTRKTLPGLRRAQKYAVRCGGGSNHRFGLFDAILIKENHILAAGGIAAAVSRARTLNPDLPVEVEVESTNELVLALTAGAERVLLDNFSNDDLGEAVRINSERGRKAELEASGNVSLESVRAIAETGVDFISVGALTKSVLAVDLSMRFED